MAKIGLPKGSGKWLKVREKSVKSQGILKWILSGNPGLEQRIRKYSKTCVKRPLSKGYKLVFKTNYRIMQVKSIAECSKGSILRYF